MMSADNTLLNIESSSESCDREKCEDGCCDHFDKRLG